MKIQWTLAVLLASACVRSGEPTLYTLAATPVAERYQLACNVEVRRPRIAGYLDRREIVLAVRDDRLELIPAIQWAEPLDAMIGRVLAANLAERLPRGHVSYDLGSLGVRPDVQVDLEVRRFERRTAGLAMRGLFALRRPGQSPLVETIALERRLSHPDPDDLVAAMNELLAELADRIALALSAPPPPSSVARGLAPSSPR